LRRFHENKGRQWGQKSEPSPTTLLSHPSVSHMNAACPIIALLIE
jgi:hypothetical protein